MVPLPVVPFPLVPLPVVPLPLVPLPVVPVVVSGYAPSGKLEGLVDVDEPDELVLGGANVWVPWLGVCAVEVGARVALGSGTGGRSASI